MNQLQKTALAIAINFTILGVSNAKGADTAALEKRIQELENRLAKMDQLERRLEQLDKATALTNKAISDPIPVATAPNSISSTEIDKLNRKVNTLQRKLEVQDEVTTGAFSKIPNFEAGAEGFKVTSTDKRHQLRIGGAVQTDYKAFIDNAWNSGNGSGFASNIPTSPLPAGPDSISLRQARMTLDGYVFNDLYFKIMTDFAQTNSTANLLPDAYLDYNYFSAASLLVGKFKPSISLERLQGDVDTAFLERGFPTNLAPNRDAGIQLHGAFGMPGYKTERAAGPIDVKNAFTYQVGITDGTGDSGNATGNGTPTNSNALNSNATTYNPITGKYSTTNTSSSFANDKEFDGRIFAQPFQHSGYSWLEGFGFGLAGSYSNPNHQLINAQKSLIGQSTIVDYTQTSANTNVSIPASSKGSAYTAKSIITADGNSYRIYPQAFWFNGPFGLMGEYVESTQTLNASALGKVGNNISQTNKASQVQISYVITGEDNTFNGVRPMNNFDPVKGTWGALQIAGRWSELSVDNDTFIMLDPTKSVNKATAFTIGANWFLNKNALIRLDYEDVSFTGGAGTASGSGASTKYHVTNRPSEQIFATRFQLAF
ncbi:MAG: porin [Methylococcales bacterium]|nr:porin [Methylococcales bacterium]